MTLVVTPLSEEKQSLPSITVSWTSKTADNETSMTERPAASDPGPPAMIEAAAPGDGPAEGDFATSEYEADSNASTSITSSIYKHSYENGRRVS